MKKLFYLLLIIVSLSGCGSREDDGILYLNNYRIDFDDSSRVYSLEGGYKSTKKILSLKKKGYLELRKGKLHGIRRSVHEGLFIIIHYENGLKQGKQEVYMPEKGRSFSTLPKEELKNILLGATPLDKELLIAEGTWENGKLNGKYWWKGYNFTRDRYTLSEVSFENGVPRSDFRGTTHYSDGSVEVDFENTSPNFVPFISY